MSVRPSRASGAGSGTHLQRTPWSVRRDARREAPSERVELKKLADGRVARALLVARKRELLVRFHGRDSPRERIEIESSVARQEPRFGPDVRELLQGLRVAVHRPRETHEGRISWWGLIWILSRARGNGRARIFFLPVAACFARSELRDGRGAPQFTRYFSNAAHLDMGATVFIAARTARVAADAISGRQQEYQAALLAHRWAGSTRYGVGRDPCSTALRNAR